MNIYTFVYVVLRIPVGDDCVCTCSCEKCAILIAHIVLVPVSGVLGGVS